MGSNKMGVMTHREDLVDGLAQVPLFSACSKAERRVVARHVLVVPVSPNTDMVEEGGSAGAFFFVLEGKVAVRRNGRKVATLGPGSHFGELALLDPAPRDATVTAETQAVVGVLGDRSFQLLVRSVPAISEKLLRGLARRLRDSDLRDY
jgi:CRP/FNR family transcriptional regulator, cyclic AMP receptor protein